MSLSKRELFIRDSIGLDEADVIQISNISKQLGTNKYNVWIAKETKKDVSVLENYSGISDIVDWAKSTKSDIMKHDFDSATKEQMKWHEYKCQFPKIKQKMMSQEIDEDRVVFVTSDGTHFFYILTPNDLKYESHHMLHCIGMTDSDQSYGNKISKGDSVILSLRDEDNIPMLTVEIETNNGRSLQIKGKGNKDLPSLSNKIKRAYTEFVLFSGDFKETENSKLLNLVNSGVDYF